MGLFKQAEFVIFDVETTGLSPRLGDRIIEIAALKVKDLEEVERFHSFIDPQRELSYGAFLVNGITSQMLEGAPKTNQVLPRFVEFLGKACLVGHNIKFDLSFLNNELSLIGHPLPGENMILDTLRMARRLLPGIGRYSLLNVAYSLAIDIGQTHRAMADVELTYDVFRRLLEIADRKDVCNFEMLLSL